MCKTLLRFAAALLATCVLYAPLLAQQTVNKTARVRLLIVTSCTISRLADLDYGSATKPQTGTGSVSISATTGSRSASGGVTASGSFAVGLVRLDGQNVSNYTVMASFPSTLTRSGGGSLSYARAWAQSASSSSGFSLISGTTYNAAGGGGSVTRYFRIGGTTSSIDAADAAGNYDNTASLTASCN